MKIHYNFKSEFNIELKEDIIASLAWLEKVVDSYEYNRAIKKYGYEQENRIFKNLLDGFTVNFEIWHGKRDQPCKYVRERDAIILNLDRYPYLSTKLKAGYNAHEICHELDRFDHGSHQMTSFTYFTQYKIPKLSLKEPVFFIKWIHKLIDLF